MAVLQSAGQLLGTIPNYSWQGGAGGVRLADHWMDYATIYRTQPHVRTAVDFIARNIAQLGLHVYRRVGENDRIRLRDHPLANLIERSDGQRTTRHRLIYSIMADRGIYGSAFWVKFKADGKSPTSLLRIPPSLMRTQGNLWPTAYQIQTYPTGTDLRPDQVVHFRNYNPLDNVTAVSPIESLRMILDEDLSAVRNRSDVWRHSGRQPMVIKRPRSSGTLTDQAMSRFSEHFTEALRSSESMTTPILEDDMDIMTLSFNAEQSQYVEGRKLTREEVATAYHIPLAMFGIAGAPSTYSSVTAYHESLYTDTLGPWLDDLETDIELQLLEDFSDRAGVYVEFNIAQKLSGTFLDQAEVLSKAIGRPWMTADEGRSKINLPSKGGNADQLAVPLNIDPSGSGGSVPTAPPQATPNGRQNGMLVGA